MAKIYANPIAGKVVVLVGGFSTKLAKQEYEDMLILMGAEFRRKLSGKTEILVAGSRGGNAVTTAEEQGTEVWSETQLLRAIADFHASEQQGEVSFALDPLVPACQVDLQNYTSISSYVMGKRVVFNDHDVLNGALFAYYATTESNNDWLRDKANRDALWTCEGVETLESVVLDQYDQASWDAFLDHADMMPSLRALVIIDSAINVDAQHLLEQFSELQVLQITNVNRVSFGVLRHSVLEQLEVYVEHVTGLDCLSAPLLSYLHLQTNNQLTDQLCDAFACGQFPLLKHLGITGYDGICERLSEVTVPNTLHALSLHYTDERRYENRVAELQSDLEYLSRHALAKQLTYLSLAHNGYLLFDGLIKQNFPLLTHLKFKAISNQNGQSDIENEIERLSMTEGLHLMLQHCNLGGHNVDPLLRALANMPQLASLNLDYNCINTQATVRAIVESPYPISAEYQGRY